MLPATEIAMVKTAVNMCNSHDLRRKILCDPETYYKSTLDDSVTSSDVFCISDVEEMANILVKKKVLPQYFIGKLVPLAYKIGKYMQIWDEYHGRILDLPPGYSFEFLNRSFFTERGLIDNRKTAEALIAAGNLSIKQKYKLACLHCFKSSIIDFYNKMTEEDKQEFYDARNPRKIMQPGLVKFWTYSLMGDVDKLRGEQTYDDFRLQMIAKSGNISAFEYWLKEGCSREKDEIVTAALKITSEMINPPESTYFLDIHYRGEWTNNLQGYPLERFAVPTEYYVDVVIFLLLNMSEDEKIKFLRKDIEGSSERGIGFRPKYSKVLPYCLNWPYQYLFMKTAEVMWDFLPEGDFAVLLLKIADKLETKVRLCSEYCDNMTYDYRSLLREFWEQSPDRHKRYVFSEEYVAHKGSFKTCSSLLKKLFKLKNVAHTHIRMILGSATSKEKENIFFSEEWLYICIYLMKFKWEELEKFVINDILKDRCFDQFKRDFTTATSAQAACVELMKRDEWGKAESFIKWSPSPEEEVKLRENIVSTEAWKRACLGLMYKEEWNKLDEFILRYFQSKEKMNNFKREFSSREDIQTFCISTFIRPLKWDAAESFLEWTALNEEEVKALKRKMIKSPEGRMTCSYFFREFSGVEAIERFIRWHCPADEEVKELKRDLIFSDEGVSACSQFAENDKLELASEFINYCLSSEEDKKEIKKIVAYKKGNNVAILSLLDYDAYVHFLVTKTDTVNWGRIEKFLAWCFSSEEEITAFKRNVLLVESGKEIHFTLIHRMQWDVAEKFFAWLGLSPEEESELKKNTLFDHLGAQEMFYDLLSIEEGHEVFATYGSKQKVIELYSRWYLTDKEAVIEFRNKFATWKLSGMKAEIFRKSFDFVVTQRLKDFELSEHGKKRILNPVS